MRVTESKISIRSDPLNILHCTHAHGSPIRVTRSKTWKCYPRFCRYSSADQPVAAILATSQARKVIRDNKFNDGNGDRDEILDDSKRPEPIQGQKQFKAEEEAP